MDGWYLNSFMFASVHDIFDPLDDWATKLFVTRLLYQDALYISGADLVSFV